MESTSKSSMLGPKLGMSLIVLTMLCIIVQGVVHERSRSVSITPSVTIDSTLQTSQSTAVIIPEKPKDLIYEGNAKDEVGNTAHYVLLIKPDYSKASLGGNSFQEILNLGNGLYEFHENTPIVGIKLRPTKDACIVYNSSGGYFCTLYRRN
jgi:hypothetical protein